MNKTNAYKGGKKILRIRFVLKRLAALLCVVILAVFAWQIFEHIKLQSLLLPEGATYAIDINIPQFYKQIIQQSRQGYLTPATEEALSTWEHTIQRHDLEPLTDAQTASEAVAALQVSRPSPEWMSLKDIDVELDFLSRYMKYSFAHYDYQGGDAVFIPLFETIKEDIKLASDSGRIRTDQYIDILRKHILSNISDRHSYIGSQNHYDVFPEKQFYSYMNDQLAFQIIDDYLWIDIEGQPQKVVSINGSNPKDYIKPGIMQDGSIAHILCVYTDIVQDEICCILSFESNGIPTMELALQRSREYIDFNGIYSITETEDYYLIKIGSFETVKKNMPEINQMIKDAGTLREGKPIIIDLRHNRGGNDFYALFWLLKFLDISKLQAFNIPMPGISYDLNTQTIASIWDRKLSKPVDNLILESRYKKGGGNALHVKNDTPIFVLVDRECGSSGEWFTSYLMRLDNVVVIGENTKGMLIGGNQCSAILPISRYKATFSISINLDTDMRDLEGIGLYPDLYVPPINAEERLVAMLKYYNISDN